MFPTAEHSRFTHGLGVMHEAGLWARSLYPSLRASLPSLAPGEPVPSEGLVVETLRVAGLLHDVGHGPFAHFFDEWFLARFPAPADPRRPGAKTLSHEDLSQLVIERELGPLIRGLRRAPGRRRRSATGSPTASRSTPAGSRSWSRSRRSPTRRCRAGSGCSSRCCRACSRSTTWTTSAATPTSPGCRWGRSTPSGCGATRSCPSAGSRCTSPGSGRSRCS